MKDKGKLNNFSERFSNLNTNAKVVVAGGVIACGVAIAAGFLYQGDTGKAVLFTNLSAADASEVTTLLDGLKTKYTLKENSDGTMTVFVDEDKAAVARMEVSASFEPTSGVVGYEILDNTSLGETQSDRDLKATRALEGEITKTLTSLPFINSARVHINIASNSFLTTEKEKSSASVTIDVDKTHSISKSQAIGIIKIVANSVSGLSPANVELLDSNATLLSKGLFSEEGNTDYIDSDENLKIEEEKESAVQSKVQRLLDKVVGSGNSIVEVDLDLNFNKQEIAEQILGDKVAISEKEILKETNSSSKSEVPGTDSNGEQEDYVSIETNAGNNGLNETYSENHTNYEVSTRNEKTVMATGTINKMTISVAVDESAVAGEDGLVSQQLKDELLQNIKTAAGYNEERLDQVSLTVTKFNKDLEEAEAAYLKKENTNNLIGQGISAGVIIGIIAALLFISKKAFDTLKNATFKRQSDISIKAEAIKAANLDVESIPSNEENILLEERINKTIDTNPEDLVKAVRFMLSADETQK